MICQLQAGDWYSSVQYSIVQTGIVQFESEGLGTRMAMVSLSWRAVDQCPRSGQEREGETEKERKKRAFFPPPHFCSIQAPSELSDAYPR